MQFARSPCLELLGRQWFVDHAFEQVEETAFDRYGMTWESTVAEWPDGGCFNVLAVRDRRLVRVAIAVRGAVRITSRVGRVDGSRLVLDEPMELTGLTTITSSKGVGVRDREMARLGFERGVLVELRWLVDPDAAALLGVPEHLRGNTLRGWLARRRCRAEFAADLAPLQAAGIVR